MLDIVPESSAIEMSGNVNRELSASKLLHRLQAGPQTELRAFLRSTGNSLRAGGHCRSRKRSSKKESSRRQWFGRPVLIPVVVGITRGLSLLKKLD